MPRGNVLIAGTTAAPGYPTTPNSYQPNYTAASKTVVTCGPPIPMEVTSPSGYVTLVKADGSGLIFSTFFSGTNSDSVSFAALTSTGIYLAGQAGSVDLPGFDGAVPSACGPVGFVTRMTLDGSAISSSHTPPGTPLAYDSTTGTLLLASGNDLLRFDRSQATPIACVLDAADLSPVTAVAPGELLAMFGRFQYFENNPFAVPIVPVNGSFPVTSQGLGIVANQTPAPLLYISEQQINFQAPYEIAGSPQTNVTVTYSDVNGNSVSDSENIPSGRKQSCRVSFPAVDRQSECSSGAQRGRNCQFPNQSRARWVCSHYLPRRLGAHQSSAHHRLGQYESSGSAELTDGGYSLLQRRILLPRAYLCLRRLGARLDFRGYTSSIAAPANPHPRAAFQAIFSLSTGSTAVRDTNLSFWAQ